VFLCVIKNYKRVAVGKKKAQFRNKSLQKNLLFNLIWSSNLVFFLETQLTNKYSSNLLLFESKIIMIEKKFIVIESLVSIWAQNKHITHLFA
jgi:hypothetical protein